MNNTGMTTLEVKKINKSKVYQFIYDQQSVSKQLIAQELQMSLTTVTHNLKILEEEGFIEKSGQYRSTGGRKANAISIVATARISVGIDILKEMFHLVAIDLYGNILKKETVPIAFSFSLDYCEQVGNHLATFIDTLGPLKENILGVGIAIQGHTSPDRQIISYGTLMNCTGMSLKMFEQFIPYPCRLEHDSTATAYVELWSQKDIKDALVFILNRNFGGAVIIDRKIQTGLGMRGGSLEHLCLDPNGPKCYCGKKGCLETYCSADSLKQAVGEELEDFFRKLRKGQKKQISIWHTYLQHLAFAIRNLTVVLDCQVILSGFLAPWLVPEDIELLEHMVQEIAPFGLEKGSICVNHYGQLAPATGAALYYIEEFLKTI